MTSRDKKSENRVFINCPFDEEYYPLLRPLLFTVIYLGFVPRLASERSDAGEVRLLKIQDIMTSAVYSIHDLSRLRASEEGDIYRLNMAFELGMEYGYRMCWDGSLARKSLVLEREPYDYMKAVSDLSGVDIKNHDDDPARLVRKVRNWFLETVGERDVDSGTKIWYEFNDFMASFYEQRRDEGYEEADLQMMPVTELIRYMESWVEED